MWVKTKHECTIEGRFTGLALLAEDGPRWGAQIEIACTVEELLQLTLSRPLLTLALEDGRTGRGLVLDAHGRHCAEVATGEPACVLVLGGRGPLVAAEGGAVGR